MEKATKKITVTGTLGWLASWFFGAIFLMGVFGGFMYGSYFSAILLLLAGCLLVPPIEKSIKQKWNFEISWGIKAVLIIVGLIVFSNISLSYDSSYTTDDSDTTDEVKTVYEETTTTKSESKTTTQTTEKQIEAYYLKEPVQIGSFEYTINSYYTTTAIGQNLMGTFMGETADGVFLVVDVTIENIGTESITMWDSMIKVVDDQGRTYDHDMNAEVYLSMSNKKAFTFEQLQPGLPKRGYIVFDVPTDLKGSFEISSNNLFSSEKKYIAFFERP